MVDLKKLREKNDLIYEGKITKVQDLPLNEYLGNPDLVQKFKDGITKFPLYMKTEKERQDYKDARLEATVTAVWYVIHDEETNMDNIYSEFYNPVWTTKSTLYKVCTMNNLSRDDTQEWIGSPVRARKNKDGNMRLLGNDF